MALAARVSSNLSSLIPPSDFQLQSRSAPSRVACKLSTRSSLSENSEKNQALTRRSVCTVSLVGLLAAAMAPAEAEAKDVPLFGIKKKGEAPEVTAPPPPVAVPSAPAAAPEVAPSLKAVSEPEAVSDVPAADGFSPVVQAGAVAAIEAVAVATASTIVGSIVSSK